MPQYITDSHGTRRLSYVDYRFVPTHTQKGTVNGVILYASDATARQMRVELERLQMIFDYVGQVALALYDTDSRRLRIANPRYLDIAERVWGTRAIVGQPWPDSTPLIPAPLAESLWQEAIVSGTPIRQPDIRYTFEDGALSVWDWTITPMPENDRVANPRFVLVAAVDITDQVQARTEIERLLALQSEFVAIASHELRGPLTVMKGRAQMLGRMLKSQDNGTRSAQDMVAGFDSQINRMAALIDEIGDVTRLRTGQFVLNLQPDVEVVALVRQLVTEYQDLGTTHPIHFETNIDRVTIQADAARLTQVVGNLIDNAAKYSELDAHIAVSVDTREDDVQITIRDSGVGIAPEQQAHIFDRFYRVSTGQQASGLGLGLYISNQIIQQHRGQMRLESTPGVGSAFTISLPYDPGSYSNFYKD